MAYKLLSDIGHYGFEAGRRSWAGSSAAVLPTALLRWSIQDSAQAFACAINTVSIIPIRHPCGLLEIPTASDVEQEMEPSYVGLCLSTHAPRSSGLP
jgi:hypothetical protein